LDAAGTLYPPGTDSPCSRSPGIDQTGAACQRSRERFVQLLQRTPYLKFCGGRTGLRGRQVDASRRDLDRRDRGVEVVTASPERANGRKQGRRLVRGDTKRSAQVKRGFESTQRRTLRAKASSESRNTSQPCRCEWPISQTTSRTPLKARKPANSRSGWCVDWMASATTPKRARGRSGSGQRSRSEVQLRHLARFGQAASQRALQTVAWRFEQRKEERKGGAGRDERGRIAGGRGEARCTHG
jgi:hypothetical protein